MDTPAGSSKSSVSLDESDGPATESVLSVEAKEQFVGELKKIASKE